MLLEREVELQELRRCLGATSQGVAGVVLIEAPAGGGKTRLIEAATSEAEARGLRVLVATARELERHVPGAVARRLLGADAQVAADVSSEDPAAAATLRLAASLERMLGEGAGGPLAVLVDDAHWADVLSLQLLAHVASDAKRFPLALVLALRPDAELPTAIHSLRALPGTRQLRPEPLSAPAVTELVRLRLPRADPEFCAFCLRATAGNPFLLTELLEALGADGLRGSAEESSRLGDFVPQSVLSSVLVRVARLSEPATVLARAVSILGEAPLRQAAALAELDALEADTAADVLEAAGLLAGGDPLRFGHPLVATAIYQDQAAFARARAHRRAAEIIAADGGPVEVVATHLQLARPEGDEWVVERLRQAARRALSGGDPDAAAALLERALAEPPTRQQRAPTLMDLADAEAAAGSDDALERLRQALELVTDPRMRAEALYDLGLLLLARHDLSGAAACAEEGLAEADEDDSAGEALEGLLLASAGLHPLLRARVDDLQERLRASALAGRDPADPLTLSVLALRMAGVGDSAEVVRRLVAAALANSDRRPAVRAATVTYLGAALVYVEDLGPAEEVLTAAIEQADSEGRVVTRANAQLWRATARLRCGDLAAASADAQEALRLQEFGWQLHVGPCAAVLAEALLEQGDEAGAREALATGEFASEVAPQPLLLAARARLALQAGDVAEALAAVDELDVLRARFGIDNPIVLPWRSLRATATIALGDAEQAVELALDEADLARRLGSERALGVALCTAGAAATGERGRKMLEEAVATLSRTPAALEHARALVELGASLRRTRERAAAREPLRKGRELAASLGAIALAERARDELLRTGARPRRVALSGVDSLTPTERMVASLAAEGMSNKEIAAKLVVTTKTVEWHLGRVYSKLDVSGRRELDPAALRG